MSGKLFVEWLIRTTILSGAALATGLPAFAQYSDVNDVIIVTGTRIQREDLYAPSPVVTVNSEQLTLTNTVNTEQFLNTLPQFVPSFDRTSNNPGDATAQVDLRGLGENRTLVLVDGARFVGLGPNFVVDLNNIPSALLERIEVVTGGASAVYGSDAVAGVVNFILKKDFEGVQIDVSHELSAAGWDANTTNVALTTGGNFAEGRGNVVVFASYANREALLQGAREFSQLTFFDPGPGGTAFIEGGSPNIPQVRFVGATSTNFNIADPSTVDPLCGVGNANLCFGFWNNGGSGAAGDIRGLRFGGASGVTDLYNFAPDNYLQLPLERYNITAVSSYEVNDHIEAYMRGVFSRTVVDRQLAPTATGAIPVVINLDNPAIPATLLAIIAGDPGSNNGDGTANIGFHKRLEELGTRNSSRTTNGFQILAGLRGDLNDQWSYDTFFNFSRSTVSLIQSGNASRSAIQAAVLCDTGPTAAVSGCTAPYLDIFGGQGGVSPTAAAFIMRTGTRNDEIEQTQWVGTLSGYLDNIHSPWADTGIALVVGLEYRELFANSMPDSVLGPGVLGFDPSLPIGGRYDIYEAFSEVQIPVITGMTFIDSFAINGAYRYSSYSLSNVGGVHSFAAGGDWSPIPEVRFRAQFQRAVRAPNIGELFTAVIEDGAFAKDPCSTGLGSFTPATIISTCTATGVPITDIGTSFQSNNIIRGTSGGNPNLVQETANTLTIGMVWRPEAIDGLSLQVDYYDISILGGIIFVPLQISLNECHLSNIASQCAIISTIRNPVTGDLGDAAASLPAFSSVNAASIDERGIDLNATYQFDIMTGSITAQYYGAYLFKSDIKLTAGSAAVSCAGNYGFICGEPTPEYKHTMQVSYVQSPLTTSLRWRAIGGSTAGAFTSSFVGDLSDNIPFTNYIDVTTQYAINENLDVTVGVKNITGKDVPILGVSEQANTFPSTYTPFGRQVFFAASAHF